MWGGNGFPADDVYRAVILDVVQRSKEAFEDHGVELDYLAELKTAWENRLRTAGTVDLGVDRGSRPVAPNVARSTAVVRPVVRQQPNEPPAKKNCRKIGQLDGDGGEMTDSSSGEEENDSDDGLKEKDDQVAADDQDEPGMVIEPPLNSDDDPSEDDEDAAVMFDAPDVVMCQFEKVNRMRSKWKFTLKDGVMNLAGRDYVFKQCTGETEF